MPKSIQITSPSLNNDAEYNALLQQLAAFSPAKMMSTTMAMRRQERTEEKYQETQERLLRQEKDSSAKTVLGLIDDGLKDLESGDDVLANTYDFITTNADGIRSIDEVKLFEEYPELAGTSNVKAWIGARNIRLQRFGSRRNFQNNFLNSNTGLHEGKFAYEDKLEGKGDEKDVTGKVVLDLYDTQQIIDLANNPKEGKKVFDLYLNEKNKYAKMKPVGSTENYLKHYSDKFNYVDRVMAAIRYNNFRVENNLPSFMTNEQVRSDVIAGVTTGKSDIGQIFVAEGIEDTRGDLGELQAKINATEELIKSDKLDWKYIAGNQNPQNRETTILNYISRNQVDTAYPIGELQNAVGNPESEVTVKLSADGKSLPIRDMLLKLNREISDHRTRIQSKLKKSADYENMKSQIMKTGATTSAMQYNLDNQHYKMVNAPNRVPARVMNNKIMDYLGITVSTSSDKPTSRKEFVFSKGAEAKVKRPYVDMYNLMLRWSEQYLRNNPEMKIKETDGYRDWNTVSSSSDFEDFIKNKFIEDSDIIEKIYQRNESLIEVQKDKETIGGVHLEDNRTLNGLAIAPYARGDGTMFEAEFNLDHPIIAGKKTIRNVTDNQDVKIDADAFDDYVKKSFNNNLFQHIDDETQDSWFVHDLEQAKEYNKKINPKPEVDKGEDDDDGDDEVPGKDEKPIGNLANIDWQEKNRLKTNISISSSEIKKAIKTLKRTAKYPEGSSYKKAMGEVEKHVNLLNQYYDRIGSKDRISVEEVLSGDMSMLQNKVSSLQELLKNLASKKESKPKQLYSQREVPSQLGLLNR